MIGVGLCVLLLVLGRGDPAVEREWEVRRHVLDPHEHAAARIQRARAADWTERAAAWETFLRADRVHPGIFAAEPAGRFAHSTSHANFVAALRAALDDVHPNVRALALEFLAEHPRWVALEADAARRLARDPLPQVRVALARVLEVQLGPVAVDVLARLAEDSDARVGARARRALFRQERSAEPAKFAALERFDPREERAAFAERLTELAAGEPTATVLRALEDRVAGDVALEALVASLGARTDTGGDVDALARGWLEVGALPSSARSLAREALVRIGARAGRALVLRAREVEGAPAWRTLFDGALDTLAPEEFLTVIDDADLPPEAALVAWEALAGRSAEWTAERVAPWLDPERDARLRAAVATAVFDAFHADEDPRTGELVAQLLADEGLADEAFEVLCAARDPRPWLAALHRFWRDLPEDERIARLRRLPRDVVLAPFRADFLRLGHGRRAVRTALAELLAPFAAADEAQAEDVRAALLEWLDEAVAAVSLTISSGTPEWRASELRATGLARALASFDPPRTAPLLRAAIFTLGDASVEFGKIAAWALGQSVAGRVELASVQRSELPRRVRVEAASWRARDGDPAAVALLQRCYPTCDLELKERLLREFGELEDESSAGFLAAVAADPRAPAGLRISAAASLERRGAADALARALSTEADVDVRVALIESLGGAGDVARAQAELLPELVAFETEQPGRLAAADEAPEVRAALREAVLIALAAAGSSAPELQSAWLRRPLARSASDLAARFGALPLASTTFSHRAELQVAEHLARAGELERALAAAGPWWRADGRFLLELSMRAAAAGDEAAAERVARGAFSALLGEPPGDGRAELVFRAELQLLVLEERRGAFEFFARRAERLLRAERAGEVPQRAWRAAFGEVDRRRGTDPDARLESAALQARALAALERGERTRAAELARAAERFVGFSNAARAAQERLRARLADEDPPPPSRDGDRDE